MTRKEEILKQAIKEYPRFVAERRVEFISGAEWADKNPNPRAIAEFLHKEKGYSITLNGEILTFEEAMKDVQIYNAHTKKKWIEKACQWLREQEEMIGISFQEDFIERFKQAMEKLTMFTKNELFEILWMLQNTDHGKASDVRNIRASIHKKVSYIISSINS